MAYSAQPPASEYFRAAQYMRMSTERQEYSIENQTAAIAAYAAQRNLRIVRVYADEGRSGLRLEGRGALQRLIHDVQSGQSDFRIVLVCDVSRWGRFQDADESAYYEFICKRRDTGALLRRKLRERRQPLLDHVQEHEAGYGGRIQSGAFHEGLHRRVQFGAPRILARSQTWIWIEMSTDCR